MFNSVILLLLARLYRRETLSAIVYLAWSPPVAFENSFLRSHHIIERSIGTESVIFTQWRQIIFNYVYSLNKPETINEIDKNSKCKL